MPDEAQSPASAKPTLTALLPRPARTAITSLGYVGALITLMILTLLSYRSISELRERAQLVEHTLEVQLEIQELIGMFSSARVAWRQYLINGKSEYLASY